MRIDFVFSINGCGKLKRSVREDFWFKVVEFEWGDRRFVEEFVLYIEGL